MDTLLLKKENHIHSCRDNGFRGRTAFRQLRGDISDIVPGLDQEFTAIEGYYREISLCLDCSLGSINHVFTRSYECEAEFARALRQEYGKAELLRNALKEMNRLIDPRRVGGTKSLMQLSIVDFAAYADGVFSKLAEKSPGRQLLQL